MTWQEAVEALEGRYPRLRELCSESNPDGRSRRMNRDYAVHAASRPVPTPEAVVFGALVATWGCGCGG